MKRNGMILLVILICIAFLVSCGRSGTGNTEKGELVNNEAEGHAPSALLLFSAR